MTRSWNLEPAANSLDGFRIQCHFWAFCLFIFLSWRYIPDGLYFIISALGTWMIASDHSPSPDNIQQLWTGIVPFGKLIGNFILCFSGSVLLRRILLLKAPSVLEAENERKAHIEKITFQSKLLEQELNTLKKSTKLAKRLNQTESDLNRIRDEIKSLKTELVSTKRALKKIDKPVRPKHAVNDLFDNQSLPIANLPTQVKPKRRFFKKAKPEGYDF